jgi:hypothetical protein
VDYFTVARVTIAKGRGFPKSDGLLNFVEEDVAGVCGDMIVIEEEEKGKERQEGEGEFGMSPSWVPKPHPSFLSLK